jgi:phage shock protein PspC (stress-responsive transcriptional regulator)
MGLAEEIEKLQALRNGGALSEHEFARAKEQLLSGAAPAVGNGQNALQAFRRSAHDRLLGGVCGGLGESTPVPAWCWRVLFCVSVLFVGFGVLLYILLWIFAPAAQSPA